MLKFIKSTKTSYFCLALAVAAIASTTPVLAMEDGHESCDAHAKHIDHEIGAHDALEAFHVLHGDNAEIEGHHIIEDLKHDHPDVEHELEEFVAAGCTAADLEAHAHDDDH